LQRNFDYYKLEGSKPGQSVDELLGDICKRDISLLQDSDLVSEGDDLKCTALGEAMARYYIQFETMKIFNGLQPKAKISEIVSLVSPRRALQINLSQLSALVQAAEFKELRFRSGEKSFYKELNSSPSTRFPIPVDLALPAHKASIILQSVLGGVPIYWDDQSNRKHRTQYTTDMTTVFKHIHRMIRCVIDCQLTQDDSISARNALMLERSLGARVWDDSPLQMKQIDKLGNVAIIKLVGAGIKSIEDLETTEPHRIEMVLGRNPPFGLMILEQLKLFPKPRVSIQEISNSVRGLSPLTYFSLTLSRFPRGVMASW
jgi:ATP-dependent DNA helicase HFM1/MER3